MEQRSSYRARYALDITLCGKAMSRSRRDLMDAKSTSAWRIVMMLYAFITASTLLAPTANAFEFLGFGRASWEEEVLLHDQSKLVITRSQSYGGRHEIGQSSPIKEHFVSFVLPVSKRAYTWVSEYGDDVGRTNFNLIAVHVLGDVPYVIAEPNLCYSYGKWGRPNPPYVIFRHDGTNWKRIPLAELPLEFHTINVAVAMPWDIRDGRVSFDKGRFLSAQSISARNKGSRRSEHQQILRGPLPMNSGGHTSCPLPSDAAAKLIAPEVDGKLLHFNWWPLAPEWLKTRCPGCDQSAVK